MIRYFSVENFKNFEKKIEFDFSDVKTYQFNTKCVKNKLLHNMIIYGKNATGKTNLGYALFDITHHLVDKVKGNESYKYYLNANSDIPYATFNYEFDLNGDIIKYEYRKTDVATLIYEKLVVNNEQMFEYDFIEHDGRFDGLKARITDTLIIPDEFDISIVRYIAGNSILPDNSPIKKLIKFVANMLWFRSLGRNSLIGYRIGEKTITDYLLNNNLVDEFSDFLNECGVKDKLISKKDPSGEEIIYIKGKKLIPFIGAASSGTVALAMFYVWFHEGQNLSFLWIDEFDAFYHYELAEKIVMILEEKINCQVVLTSHNTNLLSNKIMRPDCYFILANGKLTSIVNATDRELREGHNLEKLYINGEFDEE
jgi:hypothetical protein|nr:MAG TPA: AAA domain protein [Caudoviricetes sp.]